MVVVDLQVLQLQLTFSPTVSTVADGPEAEVMLEEVAHLIHCFHAHARLEQEDENEEGYTDSYHRDRKSPVVGTYSKLGNAEDRLLRFQLAYTTSHVD